jgi:predicted DNA binding protein
MDICNILRFENSPLNNIYVPNVMPSLSKQQKIALELAYEQGYYSYPRKVTLRQLAKKSKVGLSTFQEHLRKAELRILPAIIKYQKQQ